jgi:Ca-activated chloride channel homolog
MRSFLTSALIALTAVVALRAGAAQQPTFRTGTRIVPVLTTVQDPGGRLVPSLEQQDFTVLDNGKPQELAIFENTIQPFTVVVMLDFSGSMTANLKLLKEGTEQFLLRMLPADKGQVGAFSDRIMFSGKFTNNRDSLISALQDLQYGNPTRLFDAVDASIDTLKDIEGRKVVLVFTDGDDTASRISYGAVRDRARDTDTMIYAIGLRSQIGGISTRPDPNLRKLADATGGGYFELRKTDELGPTFTRVAQELHSLYTLGFAPEKLDGKEHKIEVRLKDTTMKVRARTSYVASLSSAD